MPKILLCSMLLFLMQAASPSLDDLVAPIALYPDPLLAQVLAASTNPLDIVDAVRWLNQNNSLKGAQLKAALDKQPWDESVKALVATPDVLHGMNARLDWTRKLGEAVVSQSKDVMAAIQRFRARASAQGSLKTTTEQKVVEEEGAIRVEPVNPAAIAVPMYSVQRVNDEQFIPAGAPTFGTREYDDYYGFWGMSWGYGGGIWVAPPVNVEVNVNKGYYTSISQNARATRWQPRTQPTAQGATSQALAARGASSTNVASKSAASKGATAQSQAAKQRERQLRGDEGTRRPRQPDANQMKQIQGKRVAAFSGYGGQGMATADRRRGQMSRQHLQPRPPRPPPQNFARAPQPAFQGYGNGNQARQQSTRGRASRGGGGGGGRGRGR